MGLRPSSLGVATRVGGGVHFQYILHPLGGRWEGGGVHVCTRLCHADMHHRRPTNKIRPASYFAPEASRPPPCNVFIASSRCLIIRSTHGVTSRHSMYRILPTQPHAILPAGLSAKLDLRLTLPPPYQAPPHSHNRRSCRSRSRTRKSLRGRIY